MNCVVVDDSKVARTAIKQLISQFDFLTLQRECSSALEAFNYFQKHEVDLVFLDVAMPGMSGIELIKNLEKRPIIILVTAKKNYAVEAFELCVADYVVKPVSLSRFAKAVAKAEELYENIEKKKKTAETDYIFVRSNSILTKVNSNGILYVQDTGDDVFIFTADKRHKIHSDLNSLADKLPQNKFYKMNQSYLVAIDKIDSVEENTAFLGKYNLPIGKQYKNELMKKLNLGQ